ncbi:hypothetical protein MNBD_BACTEROID01-1533 [hydrothermal vent metagenome]|uniref:Dienelactone hydrolase domain-containing protein n=1 Tax=hydrothermal vent metagenome TaxID=652676 RepID=A0A3B0TWV9_9ZZZZ
MININRRKFIAAITQAGVGLAAAGIVSGFPVNNIKKLAPLLTGPGGNPITTLAKWKVQRGIIKKRWLDYLGALTPNPVPPILRVINEDRPEGLIRQLVEYEGEPGITVKGYLLRPQNIKEPLPGIVAMHSTSDGEMKYISGVEQGHIVAFGYNLAKQGFVVFCPQCFLRWHENKSASALEEVAKFQKRHPGSKGMAKMLFDAQRAVDVLDSLEIVDSNRIGAMGHSLGAKEVFYLGAFDDRVKVIVSNEGGIGIDFSNWDAPWYLGEGIHDFGHQHHEVLSLVAPKPFLLIGGGSADGEFSRPYIEAVKPVYGLYGKNQGTVKLLNHGKGHGVAPIAEEWTYKWMEKYLWLNGT